MSRPFAFVPEFRADLLPDARSPRQRRHKRRHDNAPATDLLHRLGADPPDRDRHLRDYLALLILLRIAGQRTLAKWYAFDLIVTVALGSTFANGILSKDVSIAQSIISFVILVALQFIIDGTFSVIAKLPENASALADIPELGGSNEENKEK